MPESSLLTILMPTLDRGALAMEAVSSILKSGLAKKEIEIVVLDNCSTKDVDGYQSIASLCDERVTYVRRESRQDFAEQFLQLTTLANGRYFMFLSDEERFDVEQFQKLKPIMLQEEADYFSGMGNRLVKYESPMTSDIFRTSILQKNAALFSRLRAQKGNFVRELYIHNALGFCYFLVCDDERIRKIDRPPVKRYLGSKDAEEYGAYYGLSGNRRPKQAGLGNEPYHMLSKEKYYLPEKRNTFLQGWLALFQTLYMEPKGLVRRDWQTVASELQNLCKTFYSRMIYCCLQFSEDYRVKSIMDHLKEMNMIWSAFLADEFSQSDLKRFSEEAYQSAVDEYESIVTWTTEIFLGMRERLERQKGRIAFFNCSGLYPIMLLRLFQDNDITIDYFFDDSKANIYWNSPEKSNFLYPCASSFLTDVPRDTLMINTSMYRDKIDETMGIIQSRGDFEVMIPFQKATCARITASVKKRLNHDAPTVLYGCGDRGHFYDSLFKTAGIKIDAYCDGAGKNDFPERSTLQNPFHPECLQSFPGGTNILVTPSSYTIRNEISAYLRKIGQPFQVLMLE